MRPDGQIERHDELASIVYYKESAPGRDSTRRDRGAALADLFDYIEEALTLYQSYYLPISYAPLNGYFPYAWYLKAGTQVDNTTIGTTYTIEEVEKDPDTGKPTGYVRMSGSPNPALSHRLKFRKEDLLIVMHSFPKTYADPYTFSKTGDGKLVGEYKASWRDTITWLVTRKEPGSLSGEPFKRPRTLVPMPRRHFDYGTDDAYAVDTHGQWFDSVVQFDCWAKTNAATERLMSWFEGFMALYTPVFVYNGIARVFFWERAIDELVTRWRDDIVNRTIRYYVRTETVTVTLEARIRSIIATISIATTGEVTGDIPGTGELPTPAYPGQIPVIVYENRDS
jgi:hypothetical protein